MASGDNKLPEVTKEEFERNLKALPAQEQKYYHQWWTAFQEVVTWDQFRSGGYKILAETTQEVNDHIVKITGKPEQLKLAFMPTEIARTSPFFPMSRMEMKDRPLYKEFVIKNKWGSIAVSGPKLSIQDESVLLAILFLAKKIKSERIKTDYAELCGIMMVSRGLNSYKSIEESLKRLTKTIVDTDLYESGNNEKVVRSITGSILSNVDQKQGSTTVEILLNPYFLTLYGANLTTGIKLDLRAKLKGDVTKALYRFLETHTGGGVPYGMLTLCYAINLNTEQPFFEIRKLIRRSLAELQKQGYIKRWKIDKNDLVYIYK